MSNQRYSLRDRIAKLLQLSSIKATGFVRSKNEPSQAAKHRYAHIGPTPLTEEQVRNLPVAHQYSS